MQFELTETEKDVFKHISGILNICNFGEYCLEDNQGPTSDEIFKDMLKEDLLKALDTLATKIGRRALSQEFKVEL